MRARHGLLVELWWQVEQVVGGIWERRSVDRGDAVSAGRVLDWLAAWAYRRRKTAERRRRR